MQIKSKKTDRPGIEAVFELSWEEFEPYYKKALLEARETTAIKGFRKGKAPLWAVLEYAGEEKILMSAAEKAVNKHCFNYIKGEQIEAILPPKAEILKLAAKNPFIFKVEIETYPEINLPDYKQIAAEIKIEKQVVKGEEVEETLEWIRRSRAQFEELKRPAEKGDFLSIEYSSPRLENNKVFQDSFILGKGGFPSGFEDSLVGCSAGEEKTIEAVLPKRKALKEKAVEEKALFKVKVKNVQKIKLPELNDAFAKTLGSFNSLKALKESIRDGIEEEKKLQAKRAVREEIIKEIAAKSSCKLPSRLLKAEKLRLMEEFKETVEKNSGKPFEEQIKNMGKTLSQISASMEKEAAESLKRRLVLRAIGRKEKIQVSDQEAEALANEHLAKYPYPEKIKEVDPAKLTGYYKEAVYIEKVFNLLEKYVSDNSDNN